MCVCERECVYVYVHTRVEKFHSSLSPSPLSHLLAVSDPWMWGGGMERIRRTTKFWGDRQEVGRVNVADAPSRATTQVL